MVMAKLGQKINNFLGSIYGESYYKTVIKSRIKLTGTRPPLLIWQMGKVGSSTVYNSLHRHMRSSAIFHVHLLSERMLEKGEVYQRSIFQGNKAYLQNHCLREMMLESMGSGKKWKIISLVREPVGRNLSSFFQNLDLFFPRGSLQSSNLENLPIDSLIKAFFGDFDHERPHEWFDQEIKGLLGLDVFSEEFPKSKGYKIYAGKNFDFLLLRMEDLDRTAHEAFTTFLELPEFKLYNKNVGSGKAYAKKYEELKKHIVFPKEYLDHCYESDYTRHFYTPEEIKRYRKKWE